ncbi:MAG TPA: protein kinase [Planctomycetota bacterium]
MGPDAAPTGNLQIGQLAVRRGFVNDVQLRDALAARSRETPPRPLGTVLVQMGFLTAAQLDLLLEEQKGHRSELKRLGKYTLVRELGRGGMGVVFEALDTDLNRKVALKTMNPALESDPTRGQQDHERFVREARLSAQLKHPHIVSVYEAGVIDGRRYLAMELVEGQPMSKWWKAKGVGLPRKLRVLRDVARALEHAHEKSILHRDLKPENVLVAAEDHAFVTDFGLAKSMRGDTSLSLTGAGLAVGTPAYMSPEQAQGGKGADGRSDVYSLGVILYEALTGQQPFRGETAIEILMKASKEPPRPPSTSVLPALSTQEFDAPLENICLKALAKKPADRYPTAQAFADDLDRWLNGEAVVASSPPSTHHTRRRAITTTSRRAPVWPWAVGAGVAAVIALALLVPSGPKQDGSAEIARQAKAKEERLIAEMEALKTESRRREEELRRAGQAATAAERGKAERELRDSQERARRAEEEAAKLRTSSTPRPTPPPPEPRPEPRPEIERPVVPPPELAPEEAWARAVPLLPLVDVGADVVSGEWTSKDGAIVSGGAAITHRLALPFKPPAEYDLRAEVTRGKSGDIVLILSRAGRAFHFQAGSGFCGFSEIGGKRATANPTTVRPTVLESELRHVVLLQVRKNGFACFVDDRLISRWRTDYADITMDPGWALPDASHLGIGAYDSRAVFHRLEIREISGAGLVTRAGARSSVNRDGEKRARSEATARAVELKAARKGVKTPEDAVTLAREHLEAAEKAVEGGDFELASRLLKEAGDISRQARDAPGAAEAAARTSEIPELKREYEKALKAEAGQDDASAAIVGRWLCFFRDRWEEGLPLFAKTSEAARRELAGAPAKDVANAWHDAAQKEKNPERRRLLQRAAFWYHRVEGADRDVERRVAAIEKETGSKTWIDLLRRLDPKKDTNTGKWDLASGALTGTSEEDWIRYHLPYAPPAEYDLRMTLQRTDGRWEFLAALPLENNARVGVVMEGYDNGDTVGFEYIDGTDADDPPYTGIRSIFDDRKPHAILVQVRRARLLFWSDGKVLIDTTFDPKKAKLDDDAHYGPPDARCLIIGLNSSTYRCTDLQVLPISGPGRLLR